MYVVDAVVHLQQSVVWICLDWPMRSSSFCWSSFLALRTVSSISVDTDRCQWRSRLCLNHNQSQNVYRLLSASLFIVIAVIVMLSRVGPLQKKSIGANIISLSAIKCSAHIRRRPKDQGCCACATSLPQNPY